SAAAEGNKDLEGLFAVYKPAGVHWKLVRDTVEASLLKGVNLAPPAPPKLAVQFQLLPRRSEVTADVTLAATLLPVLAGTPMVRGPQFQSLQVGVGHRLDVSSSGVLVLGVGQGNKALTDLYRTHVTRCYTIDGEFGMATDDFSPNGRILEKTTYEHITQDKLERVLAIIQGANQKALISYSNVDLQSQEAYELAVRGMLHPQGKSPPIVTGLRCINFTPPHFTLEVQCLNETQRYLRKLLHEVGLELRSSAICTKVRRTRDGPFTLQDALLHKDWTPDSIARAVKHTRPITKAVQKAAGLSRPVMRSTVELKQDKQSSDSTEPQTATAATSGHFLPHRA
uniref:Pseudouridine synthase II N-terminal domain-containing protein n=1 Tax=Denticeps clupeoides TaxID=299321 RepID=A0AAY4A7S4_9TELE